MSFLVRSYNFAANPFSLCSSTIRRIDGIEFALTSPAAAVARHWAHPSLCQIHSTAVWTSFVSRCRVFGPYRCFTETSSNSE